MTNLNDRQVRDAALNVVDEFLDVSLDGDFVRDSVKAYFKEGWTDPEGDPEEAEEIGPESVELDAEDFGLVREEVDNILGFLRDRTDLYYD